MLESFQFIVMKCDQRELNYHPFIFGYVFLCQKDGKSVDCTLGRCRAIRYWNIVFGDLSFALVGDGDMIGHHSFLYIPELLRVWTIRSYPFSFLFFFFWVVEGEPISIPFF